MNIVIIDDDKLVCSALRTIIEKENINVVGIGHSYNDSLLLYNQFKPDIMLMDIRMGDKNGLDAAKDILMNNPTAKVLFLTTFADDEYIIKAINIGAKGYILKQDFENIVPALNSVYSNQSVFGNEIICKVPDFFSRNISKPDFSHFNLDEKEIKIIHYIAMGFSNKEIASKMYFTEGTIRNYISMIMEKLNIKSRTQLVVFYYTNNCISYDE